MKDLAKKSMKKLNRINIKEKRKTEIYSLVAKRKMIKLKLIKELVIVLIIIAIAILLVLSAIAPSYIEINIPVLALLSGILIKK